MHRLAATTNYMIAYEIEPDGNVSFIIEWPEDTPPEQCIEMLTRSLRLLHSGSLAQFTTKCLGNTIQQLEDGAVAEPEDATTYVIIAGVFNNMTTMVDTHYVDPRHVFPDGDTQWRTD